MEIDTLGLLLTLGGAAIVALSAAVARLWYALEKERKYRAKSEKEFKEYLIRQHNIVPNNGGE